MSNIADQAQVTTVMEELSLKKQLPLRQQTPKPVLKYNRTSPTKPIQLFNQQELAGQNDPSCTPFSAYDTTPVISTPFRHSHRRISNSSIETATSLKQALYSSATSSTGDINANSAAKSHSNPYARPLSAKDIVDDLHQTKTKKSLSTTQMNGHSKSSNAPGSSPGSSIQPNSFMRPQSAVRKVSPSVPKQSKSSALQKPYQSPSKDDSSTPKSKNIRSSSSCGSPMKNDKKSASPSTLITPRKIASTRSMQNLSRASSQKFQSFQSTCNEVSTCSPQKQSFETSANDSASKPLIVDVISDSAVVSHSSLPKPGNVCNSISLAEAAQRVRNLNYTPTKPYYEVSNPSSACSSQCCTPSPNSSPVHHSLNSGTAIQNPNSHDSDSDSLLVEITKTNRAGVKSTIYYRKSSKQEEALSLSDLRSLADGAPSASLKPTEKVSEESACGEEQTDEETLSCSLTPSCERLPGDGEASAEDFCDVDDDDDDAVDNLDDDAVDDDDDDDAESDGYSFTSNLSCQTSPVRLKSAGTVRSTTLTTRELTKPIRPQTASTSEPLPVLSPLIHSLFPNIPPAVRFISESERVELLPWEMRKYLKWRLSPITPNVVKGALARIGFRITKRNHDWLGCWGKHMKALGFKVIREYQKINHFPGSFQIGRKDRLWRNLSKMQLHFGKKEFNFFPQTFVLPFDLKLLKRAWEDSLTKQKWIIKPPASARGIGIKVIHKWNQIPKRKPVIVQKYLSKPYLINGSKFDCRVYVYVSTYDPLRIYVFEDGLARFASCKYNSTMKSLSNRYIHLTNYSINKKNNDYQSNSDDSQCQGHKWGLKALWQYMKKQGINTAGIWENIKDLIIKTILCSESSINSMIKANVKSRYSVHELFGFDILLDENLKPWILEVNISPSLHSNSQLDINIKGQMIKDLMNIAGFRIPDKADLTHIPPNTVDFSSHKPSSDFCMDKRLFSQAVSPDERSKHAYYSQRHLDDQIQQTILDILTPCDIRILTESIDEDSRKGSFQRVFPTTTTHKYLRFMECPRYYNLLLSQWIQRFNRQETRGIALLEQYCEDKLHLESVTENPNHQWSPPNISSLSHREPRTASAPYPKAKESEGSLKSSSSTSQLPKVKRLHKPSLKPLSLSQTNNTPIITQVPKETPIFVREPEINTGR